MQLRFILGLALLAGACAGDPGDLPPPFDPCEGLVLEPAPEATEAERASIAAAAALWRARAGLRVSLDGDGARLRVHFRDAPLAFLGIYETGGIVINHGLTDDETRAIVIAHELGHAFGLTHVDDPASVMRPGNTSVAPAAMDALAVAALWGACGT